MADLMKKSEVYSYLLLFASYWHRPNCIFMTDNNYWCSKGSVSKSRPCSPFSAFSIWSVLLNCRFFSKGRTFVTWLSHPRESICVIEIDCILFLGIMLLCLYMMKVPSSDILMILIMLSMAEWGHFEDCKWKLWGTVSHLSRPHLVWAWSLTISHWPPFVWGLPSFQIYPLPAMPRYFVHLKSMHTLFLFQSLT